MGVLETTNEMVAKPRVALGIAGYEPTVMLFHYPAIEFLRLVIYARFKRGITIVLDLSTPTFAISDFQCLSIPPINNHA